MTPASTHPATVTVNGGAADLTVRVPYLPGMDTWDVKTAVLRLTPDSRSTTTTTTVSGAASATLSGEPGAYLRALIVAPLLDDDAIQLPTAKPRGTVTWSTAGSGDDLGQLYLVLSPAGGLPVASAPSIRLVDDDAGLYPDAWIEGAEVAAVGDALVVSELRMDLVESVDVFFGKRPSTAPHGAHELTPLAADYELVAFWSVYPRDLVVRTGGGAPVAEVTGQLHAAHPVDFAPALRGALAQSSGDGATFDLPLSLTAGSHCAVEAAVHALSLTGSTTRLKDGARVRLRGSKAWVEAGIPRGLRPIAVTVSVDGSFLAARPWSDTRVDPPAVRTGRVVDPDQAVACRITRTAGELGPLVRVSVFARAARATELVAQLHAADGDRVGDPIGPPLSIPVPPGPHPAWRRLELDADPHAPAVPEAVWVVLRATSGRVWLPTDAEPGAGRLRGSADGGRTWSTASGRAGVQLHRWVPPNPGRLTIGWEGPGGGQALIPNLTAGADTPAFRHEGVSLLSAARRLQLAEMDTDTLHLWFDADADVDLRALDLVLTYDPTTARP